MAGKQKPAAQPDAQNLGAGELSDATVESMLLAAKHSQDHHAAALLIRHFAARFEFGDFLDTQRLNRQEAALLSLVRDAFGQYAMTGNSLDVCFGLRSGRGKYRRDSTLDRDMALVAFTILATRRGWSAIDARAEALGTYLPEQSGEGILNAALSSYREALSLANDEFLICLAPEAKAIKPR